MEDQLLMLVYSFFLSSFQIKSAQRSVSLGTLLITLKKQNNL